MATVTLKSRNPETHRVHKVNPYHQWQNEQHDGIVTSVHLAGPLTLWPSWSHCDRLAGPSSWDGQMSPSSLKHLNWAQEHQEHGHSFVTFLVGTGKWQKRGVMLLYCFTVAANLLSPQTPGTTLNWYLDQDHPIDQGIHPSNQAHLISTLQII